jgi:hypothetical protein
MRQPIGRVGPRRHQIRRPVSRRLFPELSWANLAGSPFVAPRLWHFVQREPAFLDATCIQAISFHRALARPENAS